MTNVDAQRIKEIRNNTKEMTYYMKSIAKSFERIADALESKADTPQTDCETCRHYKLACELFSELCKYEPITQTETQNSNEKFEKSDCPWK